MIVRDERADTVSVEGKVEREGSAGMILMSPQSARMETRRGRWSDVSRVRQGVVKKANGSLFKYEHCCVEVESETEQIRW